MAQQKIHTEPNMICQFKGSFNLFSMLVSMAQYIRHLNLLHITGVESAVKNERADFLCITAMNTLENGIKRPIEIS